MKHLVFMLIMALGPNSPVHAYIPRVDTIVKKMVRNNGRDGYKIIRDVTFETPETRLRVKETWLVLNADNMKLMVEGLDPDNPWRFAIVYDQTHRQTSSSAGNIKKYKRSDEFFETLFHDRFHTSLKKRLVSFAVLPTWVNKITPPDYQKGKTVMTEEPFVRLEPAEGSVTYALGAQQNATGDSLNTTLWVEQDSFLIKKGRLSSKAEFSNQNFQTFPGGLKLPRQQTITWGDRVAHVQLITAEPMTLNRKGMLSLDKNQESHVPTLPVIKEFYSRFR